jgi:deoxyribodipyrimidine photo-lyase
LQRGGPVIPLYIDSSADEADWAPGAAARWWLHHSLTSLERALRERGSRLTLRRGPALETLQALCEECGADAVYWNRRHEPKLRARDARIEAALRGAGRLAESRHAALLAEPGELLTHTGGPYQVYTPFRRRLLEQLRPAVPRPAPAQLPAPQRWPASLQLAQLQYLPQRAWYAGLASAWQPGEAGAAQRLQEFVGGALTHYALARDQPGVDGSSRLSPHLHHGEISVRQVWQAALQSADAADASGRAKFLDELIWREFAWHLLHHFPHTPAEPLRVEFAAFPWQPDAQLQRAWQRGLTGVPLVDAGMRELWATGWMHNRVRMITASFLVKNLRQPWQAGARWFWDTLVDADLAANTLGWQWVAGCGADAAPYFRVFNPVTQALKFDPQGLYLRRWLPELARLAAADLHAPWLASAARLRAAGVELGRDYPRPIVDLQQSRAAALAAYQHMRSARPPSGTH